MKHVIICLLFFINAVFSGTFVVSGTLRNTGAGWFVLTDAGHIATNISSVSVENGEIRIDYGRTATKVHSLTVTPDEVYSDQYRCGANVGLSFSLITIRNRAGGKVDASTISSAGGNFWIYGIMEQDTGINSIGVITGDERYLTVNGTQATNDWGSNYSSVNIGDNSTIAYNLETSQYGNMYWGNNFYFGNDGIPRYKEDGSAVMHWTRTDNQTPYSIYRILMYSYGTAGQVLAGGEAFDFDGNNGTIGCSADISDITSGGDLTTKEFCDSTYVRQTGYELISTNSATIGDNTDMVVLTSSASTVILPRADARNSSSYRVTIYTTVLGGSTIDGSGAEQITSSSGTGQQFALSESSIRTLVSNGSSGWYVVD